MNRWSFLLLCAACADPVIPVPVDEGTRVEVCPSVVALPASAAGNFSVAWSGDDPILAVVWVPDETSTLDVVLTSETPTGAEGVLDFSYTFDNGTEDSASGKLRIRHETFPPFGIRVEVDPDAPSVDCGG